MSFRELSSVLRDPKVIVEIDLDRAAWSQVPQRYMSLLMAMVEFSITGVQLEKELEDQRVGLANDEEMYLNYHGCLTVRSLRVIHYRQTGKIRNSEASELPVLFVSCSINNNDRKMFLTEREKKSQKVGLLDLPNELLFSIIDDEKMSWRDHLNIHHASSQLFQLTFKQVYDGRRDIFEFACSHGNLDLITECLKHINVPTSQLWEGTGPRGVYLTPLDVLSSGFLDGNFSADKYIKVAEWFFVNGYHTQRVRQIRIAIVASAGVSIERRGVHPGYEEFAEGCNSIMEIMLQSAFPPALFEVFLSNMLSDRGLTLKSRLAPGDRVSIDWHEWTGLHELVCILFDDLFAPWTYKGDSPSYFSDTFEAKIRLLVKHDGINNNEQSVLENILEALRRIEVKQKDNGRLNFERDGTWCWRELCVSIYQTPFLGRRVWSRHSRIDSPRAIRPVVERPVHEFAIPISWYPPDSLIEARAAHFKDVHEKLDPSWLEDNTEQDWVNMSLDAWNFISLERSYLVATNGGRCYRTNIG
ncbi:hypothetical protein FDENT_5927 [Fusarium denticulatum]|uniref:Uncharacterized protein n=1 Tax=Fusarium denticulatum TaxID=48507 RepID=A0A8H5X899_9HYPO|nr:hypothetical protein FDENT_5927 [Fusarium denticulatum]